MPGGFEQFLPRALGAAATLNLKLDVQLLTGLYERAGLR